jgi:AraC family transcriptional regulator
LTPDFDQVVFETAVVRIGAFRCHREHPSFRDTGPATNCCFVFPRTAVEIQHEHEPPFVANPNVVTFYNSGQAYWRSPISPNGDQCDWFGVDSELVRDVVRAVDPTVDDRPERPFRLTRGAADSSTYLLQRQLFARVSAPQSIDHLAVEETVIDLLERVVHFAYRQQPPPPAQSFDPRHRTTVHDIETVLSRPMDESLSLTAIAREIGLSAYHICRLFHRVTGTKLHQYRLRLRLRTALAEVVGPKRSLTDIALDAGFSTHSHFTAAFRREFGVTPSALRINNLTLSPRTSF